MNSRILSEITSFKKNKTIENVFIKVDETNIRKIDVLIVGSKGTPYECGFFHFEFTYPNMYPNVPMNVLFKTTSNGKFRFNPNLYSNGKVCLSVINTWGKNDWTPANNLTSVILSIQALVMHDKPITNEPGFENTPRDSIDNYNNNIVYHTMLIALLENLKNSIDGKFIFADEVIEIFKSEGFAERALEICRLNVDKGYNPGQVFAYIGATSTRTTKFNYDIISSGIKFMMEKITSVKKSKKTSNADNTANTKETVAENDSCLICLKPCSELEEFNGTRKCEKCSFMACNKCLEFWYETNKSTKCPQCKQTFDKNDVVPGKKTVTKKPKNNTILSPEELAAKKQEKYEEKKAKKLFYNFTIHKHNTTYTWSNLTEKLKDAPIEDIVHYNNVIDKSGYLVFNDLGNWIMLDSPKGRDILTDHKQKIICLNEGDKKDKVFNKDTRRWVAKDNKSGIAYIKKVTAVASVPASVPALVL